MALWNGGVTLVKGERIVWPKASVFCLLLSFCLLLIPATACADAPRWTFDPNSGLLTDGTNQLYASVSPDDDKGLIVYGGSQLGDVVDLTGSIQSSSGSEYSVLGLNEWSFYNKTDLVSVVLPDSIESIGGGAFADCVNLSSVRLPEGELDQISGVTFKGCVALKSITLPSNIRTVGDGAFQGSGLQSIQLSEGLETIGEGAFYDCASLTSLVIPDGVTTLGPMPVHGCNSLEKLVVPGSLKSIGAWQFQELPNLKSVVFGEGLETIGQGAFTSCPNLESLTFPESLAIIGKGVFWGAEKIKEVDIPSSSVTIDGGAFYGCKGIESVRIGGAKEIGDGAFFGCSNLSTFEVSGLLSSLGEQSFYGCIELESVDFLEGVETIRRKTFDGCTSLETVVIPEGVKYVNDDAFKGCTSLETVVIPESVANIYDDVFKGCTSLKTVTVLPDNPPGISSSSFSGCNVEQIVVPVQSLSAYKEARNWSAFLGQLAPGYALTVTNGSGSGLYAEGAEVRITAGQAPEVGHLFAGWTVVSGEAVLTDASSSSTTLSMPAADVTVTASFAASYSVTVTASAGGAASSGKTSAIPGETVTLTASPSPGYRFAGWTVVSGGAVLTDEFSANSTFIMPAADVAVTATFVAAPSGGGVPSKTPSQQAVEEIENAKDGEAVTVFLTSGDTKLEKEVFEELSERDVTLVIELSGGVAWAVNGRDIPKNCDLVDIDMGVKLGSGTIPADILNVVTGEAGTVQLAFAHNGPFGFAATLTAPLGREAVGLWANLYYFDENAARMVYQTANLVNEDGNVVLRFTHARKCAIVLDNSSHELTFDDVEPSDWFANPVGKAYRTGLMTGYKGSGLFGPNDVLTRAQAASILWRALDAGIQAPSCDMADVDQGAWYAGAVNWVSSTSLIGGYAGSDLFGPDDALTREQLAVVLWRAASEPSVGTWDPSAYSDGGDVSSWAEPALAWAVSTGILGGSDDGAGGIELRPAAAVTRGEMAAMLTRWLTRG